MRVDFNFFRRTDDRHQNRLLNPASRMRARGNYAFHTIPVEFICYDDGCHLSKFAHYTPGIGKIVPRNII